MTELAYDPKVASKRWPTLSTMFQAMYDIIPQDHLRIFEPRKIGAPGGYHSAKAVAAGLHMMVGETTIKMHSGEFVIPQEITAQAVCYQVLNNSVPVYYVADDFARAVAGTELPQDLRIEDLKWPRSGLVVAFPQRFMADYIGMDVCYVYICQQPAADLKCDLLPGAPALVAPRDKVSWMWYGWRDGMAENYVSSYFVDSLAKDITDYNYTDWTRAEDARVERNKKAVEMVSLLVLKLLCVMNCRDGLVEEQAISRPATIKRGFTRPALWSPNFIGRNYRPPGIPVGTHASPSMHWRRGHWMYVAKGSRSELVPVLSLPRNSEGYIQWAQVTNDIKEAFWRTHYRKWIDPVLVG